MKNMLDFIMAFSTRETALYHNHLMKFSKLTFCLTLIINITDAGFAQSSHLLKYTMDSTLKAKDTSNAVVLFDQLKDEPMLFSFHEQWKWGHVLLNMDKGDKAWEQWVSACDQGIINYHLDKKGYKKLKEDVVANFGEEKWKMLLARNSALYAEYQDMDHVLSFGKWMDRDQALRKDRRKWSKKFGVSHTSYGLQWLLYKNGKSAEFERHERHDTLILLYDEFMYNDSVNLQEFVDQVLDMGLIPTDAELRGFTTAGFLFLHSSKFDFGKEYDKLVQSELESGRISPYTFGWWSGLRCDYRGFERKYYFSSSRERIDGLSDEERLRVNRARREIGLPALPATVWSYYATWE